MVQRQARDIFTAADAIAAIVPLNFPGLPFRTIVRKLYDVTEAEARVTEALLSGLTVQAIATKQGVSPQTIRTHLKSVFAKTGTARQADPPPVRARPSPPDLSLAPSAPTPAARSAFQPPSTASSASRRARGGSTRSA